MPEVVRAFLSVDIEDDELISRIAHIQQKLDRQAAKMKIVEPDNLHFTLRFFGDTPLTKIDQIRDELEKIEFEDKVLLLLDNISDTEEPIVRVQGKRIVIEAWRDEPIIMEDVVDFYADPEKSSISLTNGVKPPIRSGRPCLPRCKK